MPRKQLNDGQEIIFQDYNQISSALEKELYDRILYEMMNRQQSFVFGDSFYVSYVSGTGVSVKLGSGFQYDNTQTDPEPMNRVLYLAANTAQSITTPDPSNPRIDLVCIKHDRAVTATASRNYKDPSSGAVTSVTENIENDWASDLLIVAGTPGVSPAVPATPAGYILLAKLAVSASTGIANQAAITDMRPRFQRGNKIISKVAAYPVDLDDKTILLNASGGNFNATLPPIANAYNSTTGIGQELTFINIGASGTPSVVGNASELISDNNTQAMGPQFSVLKMVAGPTQWYITG